MYVLGFMQFVFVNVKLVQYSLRSSAGIKQIESKVHDKERN